MLGMLEIRTDPRDRIADAWRDLRLILPLLAATALVSVGVTMAVTSLVLAKGCARWKARWTGCARAICNTARRCRGSPSSSGWART